MGIEPHWNWDWRRDVHNPIYHFVSLGFFFGEGIVLGSQNADASMWCNRTHTGGLSVSPQCNIATQREAKPIRQSHPIETKPIHHACVGVQGCRGACGRRTPHRRVFLGGWGCFFLEGASQPGTLRKRTNPTKRRGELKNACTMRMLPVLPRYTGTFGQIYPDILCFLPSEMRWGRDGDISLSVEFCRNQHYLFVSISQKILYY